jgi:outer membrane protein TolC
MWTALFAAWLVGGALSFGDALRRASDLPTVQAEESARSARADLASHTSRLFDNPVLQVQPGARRMSNGSAGPEVYVTLSQRLSLSSAGKKRQDSLARETAHDEALARLSLREARRRIAEAWLSCWAAERARVVSQREVELAQELLRLLDMTFQAGEATRVDVSTARAWQAEARLSALSMEGQAFETGVLLARALGAADGEPRATTEALPGIELPACVRA